MRIILRKVAARIITAIFLIVMILFAGQYFANAQSGHIGYGEIVIDGITYKRAVTDFQKIPPSQYEYSAPSQYDNSAYSDNSYPSLDGQTVYPEMICKDTSQSECVGIQSTVTAIGKPVYGDYYKYTSLWQKIIYGGGTYYAPLDIINYADEGFGVKETEKKEMSVTHTERTLSAEVIDSVCSFSPLLCEKIRGIKKEPQITQIRLNEMRNNLNNNLDHTKEAKKTCRWGLNGKTKGSDEYMYVIKWCNGHEVDKDEIRVGLIYNQLDDYAKDGHTIKETCDTGLKSLMGNEFFTNAVQKWCDENIINLIEKEKGGCNLNKETWDIYTNDRIKQLDPRLQQSAREFINKVECDLGIRLRITHGVRTFEEQNALYAKGRTVPGLIVTNARGGESYHNYGLAIDIAEIKDRKVNYNLNWEAVGSIGESFGFEWGGRWTSFRDKPHFQITFGMMIQQLYNSNINNQ